MRSGYSPLGEDEGYSTSRFEAVKSGGLEGDGGLKGDGGPKYATVSGCSQAQSDHPVRMGSHLDVSCGISYIAVLPASPGLSSVRSSCGAVLSNIL